MTDQEKTELLERLKSGTVVVEFTKLNGEKRTMTCTLQTGIVPLTEGSITKKPRPENPSVCSVWDLNANGWRSFKWDNVVDVK